MPKRNKNQKVMVKHNEEVSMEPILQDFSITSQSDMKTDILPLSDSSLYEHVNTYDVALPNITLNQTEDVNLSSDLYPPDTTMDIANLNPPNLFKKPFNLRSAKKHRSSIINNDIQDSENETPELKRPFQRIDKGPINSNLFEEIFDSPNESITNSNIKSSLFTRMKRKVKNNIETSLFDKDLNSSDSNESFSDRRVLRRRKVNYKKLHSGEFDEVFDETLNESLNDKAASNKIPFRTLKNKDNNIETSIFDCDLNSSDSVNVSSMLETCDNGKLLSVNSMKNKKSTQTSKASLNEPLNNNAFKKRPFQMPKNKENIETSIFDCDLNSSDSINVSSVLETCPNVKSLSVNYVKNKESSQIFEDTPNRSLINNDAPKKRPFTMLKNKEYVETSIFDCDLNSSDSVNVSSMLETHDSEKCESVNILNSKNNSHSKSISLINRDNSSDTYRSDGALPSKDKDIESNLFDSNLNSSYSLHLSSSGNKLDENDSHSTTLVAEANEFKQGNSLSEDGNTTKEMTGELSNPSVDNCDGEKTLSESKNSNIKTKYIEDETSHNCMSDKRSSNVHDSIDKSFLLIEVEANQHKEGQSVSDSNYSDVSECVDGNLSHSSIACEVNKYKGGNSLSDSKNSTVNNDKADKTSGTLVKDVVEKETYCTIEASPVPSLKNMSIAVPNNSKYGENLEEIVKNISHSHESVLLSSTIIESITMPNNKDIGDYLEKECELQVSSNKLGVPQLETNDSTKHSTQEFDYGKSNTSSKGLELCYAERMNSDNENEITLVLDDIEIEDPVRENENEFKLENSKDKNNPSISTLLPSEDQKEMVSSSVNNTVRLNKVVDIGISSPAKLLFTNNSDFNVSNEIVGLSNHLSVPTHSCHKISEIESRLGISTGRSLELTDIAKARDMKKELNDSNLYIDDLSPSNANYFKDTAYISSCIAHKQPLISYEAADSSNTLFKKRRVSFLCDPVDVNSRSMERRSLRKLVENNSTEQLSTSKINRSQLSKSEFSLFIEQSSNSATSDSVYIDIHPSQSKSISNSSNNGQNSSYSNQPSTSLSARECSDSSHSSTRICNTDISSINKSHQTPEVMETSSDIIQEKEETTKHSNSDDLTEQDSSDCEETQEENKKTSDELTNEEINNVSYEERSREDQTKLEEDSEHVTPNKIGVCPEEKRNSVIQDIQSFQHNSDCTNEHYNSAERGVLNIMQEECNSAFKLPKKTKRVTRKHRAHNNTQPLNKTKVQEILDNLPYSELKKRKKCTVVRQLNKEVNIPNKKEKRKENTHVVSKKLLNPTKWITPNFYLFLTKKLEPSFGIRSRVQANNVVAMLVDYVHRIMSENDNYYMIVEEMKFELAKFKIIETHLDFHDLVKNYFDGDFRNKIFPFDIDSDWNPFEPDDLLKNIL